MRKTLQCAVTLVDNRDGSVTVEFENSISLTGKPGDPDGPRRQYASAHIADEHGAATLRGVFNIMGATRHG